MTEDEKTRRFYEWHALCDESFGERFTALHALHRIEASIEEGAPLDPEAAAYLLEVCRRAREGHADPLVLKRPRGRQPTVAQEETEYETACAVYERIHKGETVEEAIAAIEVAQGRADQGIGGVVGKAYYKHRVEVIDGHKRMLADFARWEAERASKPSAG
ncbi:hypothetical protein WKW80_05265 [Variovorax humicola]|uniref:Uncharacterized protein n=1 Tax=Variovorax humicola TaxID=1769758 RepID=A0ABU8VUT6_9BURK